ncbi:MAG: TIGR03545 family protein [Elusimicrobiota bacterium]
MRWKYFVPTVVITAVIIIFNVVFLDSFIKHGLISAGEAIFKAKVEVGSLKTKFSNLSITIKGLAVGSSGDEWKNLIEIDRIAFALKPVPLLSKKFIIEELAVEGVKWGTKRAASGALPPKKLKKIIEKEKKQDENSLTAKLFKSIQDKTKNEIKNLPAADSFKDMSSQIKNIKFDTAINVNDLESVKEMEAMKTELAGKAAQYDSRIKELNIDNKISMVNAAVEEAKSIKIGSLQDVEPAKKKIEALNQSKTGLDKSINEINALKAQMDADIGSEQDMLARINALKDKDYQMLASKFNIPSFSFGNISQSLFGPEWIGRVNQAVYYLHVARKYMPSGGKQKKKVIKPSRMKGMDVSFPKEDNPPDFLIQKISLTGTTGGAGKEGEPLDFKGTVADITSDPALLGRPTVALIDGKQGAKDMKIKGMLDHTGEIAEDTLTISYSGMDPKSFGLPSSEYFPAFDKGRGKMTGNLTLKGDEMDCYIITSLEGLKYTIPEEKKNDETAKMIAGMWDGITSFDVKMAVTGAPGNLKISISSTLDSILSERFKKIAGDKVAEFQNKAKAEIDKLTNDKKNEVMGQYTAQKDAAQKQLGDKQKELQTQLDALKSQLSSKQDAAKNQGDAEKKKAQEALDAEKKKAEDAAAAEKKKAEEAAAAEKKKKEEELKKQAEDKLKDMFK